MFSCDILNIWSNFSSFSVYWLNDSLVSCSKFWLFVIDAFNNSGNCFWYMDPNSSELELALNYSAFYYELKDDSAKACKIAERGTQWSKRWNWQNESFQVAPVNSNLEVVLVSFPLIISFDKLPSWCPELPSWCSSEQPGNFHFVNFISCSIECLFLQSCRPWLSHPSVHSRRLNSSKQAQARRSLDPCTRSSFLNYWMHRLRRVRI